ncbi:ankyrin [Didymella exigua CBS 183.55]|uniref:Ankyrin n=1 Tax=Didymella exigua CBS 183.55 TaxID=1150837 RepID=A0A6A5RMS4_9PLEO|nr:ankyrin [Didymella exigua CBS 183.55]KAF1927656.1 ankyrin [Didymella exigua CBS 183.55]
MYPYTSQSQDLSLSTNLEHVKDTGMGFGEFDSPPSSDDGIRVHSDSSNSDTDSDDTILQIHIDGEMTSAYSESRRSSTLTLSNFAGNENLVIQIFASMDLRPEELDDPDEHIAPEVMTEDEQVKAASSEVTPAPVVVLANDTRIKTTETFVLEAEMPSLLGDLNITHVLDETPSAPAKDTAYADSRIAEDVVAGSVLPYASSEHVGQSEPELQFIEVLATNGNIGIATGDTFHGVDVNFVNKRSGKTPLHLVIENPRFKGYKHLVCNPNKSDIRGNCPIMEIFYGTDSDPLDDHRKKALALLLRNESTDVEVTQPGVLNTPLHLAVRRKDPFAVAMLLFKYASVNAKNAAGSTPLLVAANQLHNPTIKDQKHLMSILLHAEIILINEKAGTKEQTALHYAVNAGVSWAVDMLLGHGADPTCRGSEDRDALTLVHIRADNDNWSSY